MPAISGIHVRFLAAFSACSDTAAGADYVQTHGEGLRWNATHNKCIG
jgi:hypothetical protein